MAKKRLTMRKITEVLRLKYEFKLSNRAIAGACKISNSTVGEYLKRAEIANVSWPLGGIEEEKLYQKLFPEKKVEFSAQEYPMPDWEKISDEKRKKGVTLRLLWEEYKGKHPEGYQYSQFCEHYQRWKKSQVEPSRHIEHTGGEEMQVDYAGLKIPVINSETGEISEASVFVATLPASNYIYAEAQASENQCNWNNAHVRALEFFGGVVKIIKPDNLKTGITKSNYYEPGVNLAYQELAEYYQFAVLPARVRRPRDKGAVENGVQNVERWVIAPLRNRKFFSLHEVSLAIKEQLDKLNNKVMKSVGRSRFQEFKEIDQPNLRPLPERPYEYVERKTATVNIDYHIEFEGHLYSVPFTLIHQKVDIHATERMVVIFHKGKSISIHPRNFRRGRYSTLREHMPPNHQFMDDINPERLIEWASSIGPQTSALVKATLQSRPFPQQAYRSCLGILSLAKKYSHPLLEQACKSVFEAKIFSSKVVQQELIHLQKLSTTPAIVETLPAHENIRGAEYYQERQLS